MHSNQLTKAWDGSLLAKQGPDGAPAPPLGLTLHPRPRLHPQPCIGSSPPEADLEVPDPEDEAGQAKVLALWEQCRDQRDAETS